MSLERMITMPRYKIGILYNDFAKGQSLLKINYEVFIDNYNGFIEILNIFDTF